MMGVFNVHPPKYLTFDAPLSLSPIAPANIILFPSLDPLTPDSFKNIWVADTTHVFQFFYPFTSINGCVVTKSWTAHLPKLFGLYVFCSILFFRRILGSPTPFLGGGIGG